MQQTTSLDRPPLSRNEVILPVTLAFFLFIVIRDAWLSDDSYITFRVVDNVLHGYGPVWNVDERVQVYTHPLWMFLLVLANGLIPDVYFASLTLSLSVSLLAAWLLASRLAPSLGAAVIGVLVLAASKSYVDFSTSGLENSLTHLLTVLFALVYFTYLRHRHAFLALTLLTSCIALTHPDLVLLFVPALLVAGVVCFREHGVKVALVSLFLGGSLLVAWELFSLFYYGSPIPNTGYAKLDTQIAAPELAIMGTVYLVDSVRFDPLLFLVIMSAVILVITRRDGWSFPLLVGMILYTDYLVEIGGDFMAGRFLSGVFLLSLIIVLRSLPTEVDLPWAGLVLMSLTLFTILVPGNRWYSLSPAHIPPGVNDERSFYVHDTGILMLTRSTVPQSPWAQEGIRAREQQEKVFQHHNIGFTGYEAGPSVHILDDYALADPLLARLPARTDIPWFAGHYERAVPAGYLRTLETGQNHIQDPHLAAYYTHLHEVVSGPLWSWARLLEVWKLNTGAYTGLLTTYEHANGMSDQGQ